MARNRKNGGAFMSYSRTYNSSVYYSGSVNVSYPASEHGGTTTAHYSGSVPVSVNLYVDTEPFDHSVKRCSTSVNGLNGAVIAMNSAQVASINNSADQISEHVISGFFNMIKSELSQNMAALTAKFKSVFELLQTDSARIEKQQAVMQDDYLRVSDRYKKIFSNLDEELEKRVVALDKNVFEIAKHIQGEQLNDETAKKVAGFLLGVNEADILQQKLLIAKTKSKVLDAMSELSNNVVQQAVYSNQLKNILQNAYSEQTAQQTNYIPVIFTKSASLSSESENLDCFSTSLSSESADKIKNQVKNYFTENSSSISAQSGEEKNQIDDAFNTIAEKTFAELKDDKSLRVYEMIKQLKGA